LKDPRLEKINLSDSMKKTNMTEEEKKEYDNFRKSKI